MQEISGLHKTLSPIETLFVVDAMLGQDAINVAKSFNDALPLTGIVLTKLDGDSRGGAALSVRHITGKPVKFVGVSEKLDGLEEFDPVRMANRILGMGDILALVEEARKNVDIKAAQALEKKLKVGGRFDLNDFLAQIGQMKNMGGLSEHDEQNACTVSAGCRWNEYGSGCKAGSKNGRHHPFHDTAGTQQT